jgi:hypothetical protein
VKSGKLARFLHFWFADSVFLALLGNELLAFNGFFLARDVESKETLVGIRRWVGNYRRVGNC